LTRAQEKLPHLTGVCTFSASGYVCKPIVILKNLKNLKRLDDLQEHVNFCTSASGWMNRELYTYFAIQFSHEMSHYRMNLPPELQEEPILLLVDGHTSRLSWRANMILNINNIQVLTFPGHCSHVLQPFDVGVASPLKAAFKDAFPRFRNEVFKGIGQVPRQKTALLRRTLVLTFIEACHRAMSPANCASGFGAAGLFPYDPFAPMSAKFTMETTAETRAFRAANRGSGK
jgi:hypothetical protein